MNGFTVFLGLNHLFLERIFDLLFSFVKSFLKLSGIISVIESGNGCITFFDTHLEVFTRGTIYHQINRLVAMQLY